MGFDVNNQFKIIIEDDLRYCMKSIEYIAQIQGRVLSLPCNEIRGFIESSYISPALYPLFLSVLDIGYIHNKIVRLGCNVSNNKLTKLLGKHGVFAYYNHLDANENKNTMANLPYTDVRSADTTEVIVDKINSLLPVSMTASYRSRFTSKLYELFINSQKHSKSIVPAKANAYKDKGFFYLSIYDAGVGIPTNVKKYLKDNAISDIDALKWAFVDGNSAADNSGIVSRGSGLGIIENFVSENHGKMFYASGRAVYHLNNTIKDYHLLNHPIVGTFVTIRINSDREHIYGVSEEALK